jgi:hypothetical protein
MHARHQNGNGNGNGNGMPGAMPCEPEIVAPDESGVQPTGNAYPIPRNAPAGCVIVRKELVWFGGGVVVGGILLWVLMNSASKR